MLEIAERDILQSLLRDNPWWSGKGYPIGRTFSLKRAYFPAFQDLAMNSEVRRSVILMGPRRVGKTVMLEQLVEHAITAGFPPKDILFASIDTPLYSGMPLERLLALFEKQTGSDPTGARMIIFDEIQYLKDWEIHLKVLTDKYPKTRFIASGSAAAALRLKSKESGAGRMTDFFLPPLTFAEFLHFSKLEEKLIEIDPHDDDLFTTTDINALNSAFIDYLNYGGYPEAVLNSQIQQNVQRYLGRDIIDKVLLRDLPSLYGIQDIQELNRLFTTIAYHTGQEISPEGLASSSGVAKNTIMKYLEYLEAAFLIVRVLRVDDSGRTFQRMRQFKVFLTNPSMRAALFAPLKPDDDAMGHMAETAIFSQWFHSGTMAQIHYARWKSGRNNHEVDLVFLNPGTLQPDWAHEVKWSDRFVERPEELKGLIEFARKNPDMLDTVGATTRSRTAVTTVAGVEIRHRPCALHCYAIGRNVIAGRSASYALK
ncbi:MAG: ATP-binding protein [Geminicoccaceae bacterium]